MSDGTISFSSLHMSRMRSPLATLLRALCTSSPFTITRPFHLIRFHNPPDKCSTFTASFTIRPAWASDTMSSSCKIHSPFD